ncbi:hypothetical protein DIPPA_50432 [Diplonema papillatum]|nr:hypothetical protein DIPPA_50432 [Diplonema papillatum]
MAFGSFTGFGSSSSSSGGFGASSSASGFGGFGAASSSAPAAGGFGSFGAGGASSASSGGGFGSFGANSSAGSSASGFGGFGASSGASSSGFGGFSTGSGAAPAAASGSFGASSGASSSSNFGGFGAAASSGSSSSGFGSFGASSSAASAGAGFGGATTGTTAAGLTGGIPGASSASFSAASTAVGGGFGTSAAGSVTTELPASWKTKTLKEIAEECERFLDEDKNNFASCADGVIRLDLALHDIGDNMLRLRAQVDDCKKAKVSLEETLYSLENDLDSLEKKVSGEVEGNIEQLMKTQTEPVDYRLQGYGSPSRGPIQSGENYDKERLMAYEKARSVEDRLQHIESRLRDKIASFNHAVGDDHSTVRSLTHILDHHVEYMRQLDSKIEDVKKQATDASERILGVRQYQFS